MNKTLQGALKSKTMWFNALSGALYVADTYGGLLGAVVPGLSALLPGFVIIGNAVLRVLTTTSLSDK